MVERKRVLFETGLTPKNERLKEYLLEETGNYLDTGESDLLEIGIGNGRFGKLLGTEFKSYWGIDPDKSYVELARGNIPKGADIRYEVGSAGDIPFDKKFDVVFYAQSWHFIRDFDKALEEIDRVLSPNGLVVILEPSEECTSWASPLLTKSSPEFDEKTWASKIEDLGNARRAINSQKLLSLVREERGFESRSDFYILKRK